MPSEAFLAWRDPKTKRWFPIGKLRHEDGAFEFYYLHGVWKACEAGFDPAMAFSDLRRVYRSPDLFPFFANRLLPRSRPDYPVFLNRMKLAEEVFDPVVLLSRSEGRRVTDAFEVFPSPTRAADGTFRMLFFVHGVRHIPPAGRDRALRLEPGEELFLLRDFQNEVDPEALALRTQDVFVIGYCPRYLVSDLSALLENDSHRTKVHVEQVNPPPGPVEQRLLCSLVAPWPANFVPFSSEPFHPLAQSAERFDDPPRLGATSASR